jgi:hypothetical protein
MEAGMLLCSQMEGAKGGKATHPCDSGRWGGCMQGGLCGLCFRQSKKEGRALPLFRFHPDAATGSAVLARKIKGFK